ncbi:outer membrane protein transport protein [Acinetobacter johnsonii]|uniref:OmpP1/FadL family transporter n=1 Tax=Acinetobacter TaxID=469 RepID=UPI00196BA25F|nr:MULTISPECIES: outer membrane protein transport protein [Acinetobacter]MDH0836863.1 outer membrane protein transport protein [Acinetobacter johnsonii]MDH0840381.1 outer membrane protein transport protein [Acinetobacter johnsonii]QSE45102.1 outer membrane protein transport protein [Acinetobacter johnsonii]UNT44043.1 outer membrane protein transport protein [Acinetobacter sp. LUNF3]WQN51390.1 outer membrane protein transport protein [Acinetobacter johnsonii]
MKLKTLTTAMILATVPMTGAFAAALDRSGQSISAFLQPGNYFEAGISVLDPNVSGKVRNGYTPNAALPASSAGLQNTSVGEMTGDYYFPSAALKLQVTDNFSFGLIYDQPFGAEVEYSTGTQKTTALPGPLAPLGNQGAFHNGTEGTSAEVKSQSISMLFGYQPTENFNFYAGPVYQTIKGDVQLRGLAYGGNATFGGYNASIKETGDIGWLAGAAFQIPDIALKASVTYRSEIEHSVNVKESFNSAGLLAGLNAAPSLNTDITTPQSVNLDFQTGIMANTVAFANVRWVDWSSFSIQPYKFGLASKSAAIQAQTGKSEFDLVAYTDDQISATVGVGRKLNDQWAGNVSVGWDSGAGNPVTTFGPTEGYWNLGLGVQYSPTPATFIAGGVKYFWLGDAKGQSGSQFNTPGYVADFKNNDAIAYGLKMGYKF